MAKNTGNITFNIEVKTPKTLKLRLKIAVALIKLAQVIGRINITYKIVQDK